MIELGFDNFALGDAQLLIHFLLKPAKLLDFVVAEHERFDHHIFGDFARARFHHHDRFFGPRDDQIQR